MISKKKKPFAKKSFEFGVFSQKGMEWKKMAFVKHILRRDVNFGIFFLFTPNQVMDEFQWAFSSFSYSLRLYFSFMLCQCIETFASLPGLILICQRWCLLLARFIEGPAIKDIALGVITSFKYIYSIVYGLCTESFVLSIFLYFFFCFVSPDFRIYNAL